MMVLSLNYYGAVPPVKKIFTHSSLHADDSSVKISKVQDGFEVREMIEGILKGTENRYYG